jgi:hypothetical protein
MHQVANLRTLGRRIPFTIGDSDSLDRYRAAVQHALQEQAVPFAIAPSCQLKTHRGVLHEGDEVTVDVLISEVDAQDRETGGMTLLRALIQRGIVLDRSDVGG